MKIKSISQILLGLLLGLSLLSEAATDASQPSVQVAYFHKLKKEKFTNQIKSYFDQNKSCKSCELIDRTPYKESGDVDESKLANEISTLGPEFQIIFINWNEKASESNQQLIEALAKKSVQGALILFTAGAPLNDEPTIALNKTIAGQIPEAVIVGEMTERERLLPNLFYGPEMLTAIKLSKEFSGQGLAPVYFVSKWVSQWFKRKPTEWVSFMKLKKNKVRKLWLGIEDFFPR
ncbi:MAG: hypothetical protein AABY64_05860 [Bdellovibrionota bacterium]